MTEDLAKLFEEGKKYAKKKYKRFKKKIKIKRVLRKTKKELFKIID